MNRQVFNADLNESIDVLLETPGGRAFYTVYRITMLTNHEIIIISNKSIYLAPYSQVTLFKGAVTRI